MLLFAILFISFVLSDRPPLRIVLDTDIGQDFDDSWALALSLLSPKSVTLEMVLTAAHNTVGRAQITAKVLDLLGRTDIPVAVGVKQDDFVGALYGWAEHYDLSTYPGKVYNDGVAALANLLDTSTEPIYILAIAPHVNLQSLITRFPDSAKKVAGIIAMSGSVYSCYGEESKGPCPEYNVAEDIPASQAAYAYPWQSFASTPLDTCKKVHIAPDTYARLYAAATNSSSPHYNPTLGLLIENFCYWCAHGGYVKDCSTTTSALYDPTAAYMAIEGFPDYSNVGLGMKMLHIVVNSKGETVIDASGQEVNEAIKWADGAKDKFTEWIANRMMGLV